MNVTKLQRRHDCSIHSKRATLQDDRTGIVVVFREFSSNFSLVQDSSLPWTVR